MYLFEMHFPSKHARSDRSILVTASYAKTSLDPIWMVWSGFGQVHLVWKPAGVQESLGPVLAECNQPVPAFHFQTHLSLPQTAQIILCKTSPDSVVFWLTMSGFGQRDPVRKQVSVQESSGPLWANTSKPIQIGCGSDPACLQTI